jgi:hypothetical protein
MAKGKFTRKPPRKLGTKEYERLKTELATEAARTKFWKRLPRLTATERAWCISALAASLLWARDNGFTFEWRRSLRDRWDCLLYARGDRYLGSASYIGYKRPDDPSRDGDLICEASTALEAILAIGLNDDIFAFRPPR